MIFLYSSQAKTQKIIITKSDENFLYLTKVKRFGIGDEILLSNLEDNRFYLYRFKEISKRELSLEKISKKKIENTFKEKEKEEEKEEEVQTSLHLIWGICDFKTLSKTLPFLNEIGVEKITFLECERTQGNFITQLKKNMERDKKSSSKLQKILEQSCQQSGRNSRMILEIKQFSEISDCLKNAETLYICDFPAPNIFPNTISEPIKNRENTLVIGPEGGFSPNEKRYFQECYPENIYQLSTSNVLRSETAAIGLAGKLLL